MQALKIIGMIPARYQSSRFPGKPLADLNGQPVIQHVCQRAAKAQSLDRVVVATDDERIRKVVASFGGEVVMTSSEHPTGTDRIAEAARQLSADVIVNIQGDEPLLDPVMIEQVLVPFLKDSSVQVATLISPLKEIAEILDANTVKVVLDLEGNILFFSRATIPYPKERQGHRVFKQIGLYAFRRSALEEFFRWGSSPLETIEGVELMRFLEHGWKVRAVETQCRTVAVDTPGDLERARSLLQKGT